MGFESRLGVATAAVILWKSEQEDCLNQLLAETKPVDAGRNGSKDSGVGTKPEFQGNKKRLPLRHEVGVML